MWTLLNCPQDKCSTSRKEHVAKIAVPGIPIYQYTLEQWIKIKING